MRGVRWHENSQKECNLLFRLTSLEEFPQSVYTIRRAQIPLKSKERFSVTAVLPHPAPIGGSNVPTPAKQARCTYNRNCSQCHSQTVEPHLPGPEKWYCVRALISKPIEGRSLKWFICSALPVKPCPLSVPRLEKTSALYNLRAVGSPASSRFFATCGNSCTRSPTRSGCPSGTYTVSPTVCAARRSPGPRDTFVSPPGG